MQPLKLPLENQMVQCGREDLDKLEHYFKIAIANRRRAMNGDLPLLNLPTEILLDIGKMVLSPREIHQVVHKYDETIPALSLGAGKSWFAEVLPLLQTCTQSFADCARSLTTCR